MFNEKKHCVVASNQTFKSKSFHQLESPGSKKYLMPSMAPSNVQARIKMKINMMYGRMAKT